MNIARPVTGYQGLVETCRARADELAISRLELDRLAGLPAGYSGKLLGNPDKARKPKRMWPGSLESILGALGLQIIVIEDHVASSRTLSRRSPVDQRNQRFGNNCNSPKRLPPPQQQQQPIATPQTKPPLESHAHLRVVQMKRRGKYG